MDMSPRTLEYLKYIARETAKMSYPGRMGTLVEAGTKDIVEKEYFVKKFPMQEIWDDASKIKGIFDERWHHERVQELSQVLKVNNCVKGDNQSEAIAAKFLDTFMFQLMKYERCRPLWNVLHLPIDSTVLDKLRSLSSSKLQSIRTILEKKKSAYSLEYKEYADIQKALWELVDKPDRESRIELNALLWAKD